MKYSPQWKPGAPCPRNIAVECADQTQCARCGWNPKVAEKRLANIIEERKQKRRAAGNG